MLMSRGRVIKRQMKWGLCDDRTMAHFNNIVNLTVEVFCNIAPTKVQKSKAVGSQGLVSMCLLESCAQRELNQAQSLHMHPASLSHLLLRAAASQLEPFFFLLLTHALHSASF